MSYRTKLGGWALLAASLLSACGSAGGSAAPTASTARSAAPATAAPSAAATQPRVPTAAAASSAIPEGVTAEGYHMLGRPDAPVTLTMYSDFL